MKSASGPYNVGGGHLVATVCGLVSYHTVAYGTDTNEALTSPSEAFSGLVFSLTASALVAVTLTTFGTLVTGTNPPAACATALIVGLGLLSSLLEGAYVMLAVVVLVGAHGEVIYPTAVELGFEPEDPREETADGLFTADIGRDVPENLVVAEDPTAGATGVVHSVVVGVDEAAGEELGEITVDYPENTVYVGRTSRREIGAPGVDTDEDDLLEREFDTDVAGVEATPTDDTLAVRVDTDHALKEGDRIKLRYGEVDDLDDPGEYDVTVTLNDAQTESGTLVVE